MIHNDKVARHVEAGTSYVTQDGYPVIAVRQIARKKWVCEYSADAANVVGRHRRWNIGRVAGTYHPSELIRVRGAA